MPIRTARKALPSHRSSQGLAAMRARCRVSSRFAPHALLCPLPLFDFFQGNFNSLFYSPTIVAQKLRLLARNYAILSMPFHDIAADVNVGKRSTFRTSCIRHRVFLDRSTNGSLFATEGGREATMQMGLVGGNVTSNSHATEMSTRILVMRCVTSLSQRR